MILFLYVFMVLDFVEMGEREHKNLVSILGSLIKRDGYEAGRLMVDTVSTILIHRSVE